MRKIWNRAAVAVLSAALAAGAVQAAAFAEEPYPLEIAETLDAQSAVQEEFIEEGADPQAGLTVPEDGAILEETPGNENGPIPPEGGLDTEIPAEDGSEESEEPESGDFFVEEIETLETALPVTEEEELHVAAGEIGSVAERTAWASSGEMSDNIGGQDYSRWAYPICSYLAEDGSGYLRVESCEDGVLVERFNGALEHQSQNVIPRELELFGGFYAGSSAYYLVFGQSNHAENDNAEVVRIVKYDKNWNRLDAASLCGANTAVPFDAGSLRMTEYGGYLYIRTAHEMYTTSDGLNHQANLTIQVRTSDMEITDYFAGIMNIGCGYVSHSFNQFILADDAGNLVALDHGDAHPRSFVIGTYAKKAGEGTFLGGYWDYTYEDILEFQGETGDNSTGASVGGLEYSDSSYLAAWNTVPQDGGWDSYNVRNVFVSATPRGAIGRSGTTYQKITDYSESGGISASTPQLVKLSSDRFLVLWEEIEDWSYSGNICYLFLDGGGRPVGTIQRVRGHLSDCQPIATEQGALWYVTDGERLMFYHVYDDGSFRAEPAHMHTWEPEMSFQEGTLECGLVEGTVLNPLTTNSDGEISYSSDNTSVAEVSEDGTVTLKGLGSCTITATASAGVDYRAKSLSYTLQVLDLLRQEISAPKSLTCAYGDADFPLQVSCQGNPKMSYASADEKVVSVSANGTVTVNGCGSTVITVRASRNGKYAGATARVDITVAQKDIGDCRLIFSKIGSIPADEYEDYLLVVNGTRILEEDEDYYFWWSSRHYTGNSLISASVLVEGYGNYTGEADLSVRPISEKPVLLSVSGSSRGVVVKWEEEPGALGYVIRRKQGSGKYEKIRTIDDCTVTSWTDPDGAGGDTYCIRAYTLSPGGELLYTKDSEAKTVKGGTSVSRKISDCTVTLSKSSYAYNGKARKPAVTVKDGSRTLKKGTDYTVSYSGNKDAGTASAVITGKGDYSGSTTKHFKIKKCAQKMKASVPTATLTVGKTAEIRVEGSVGQVTYKSEDEKTVSVSSSGVVKGISGGTAVITVKAAGDKNHKSASCKVRITVGTPLSSCKITLPKKSYKYTGQEIEPKVTVKQGSKTLKLNQDYTVKYKNNRKVGKASVIVTGKGSYTGKVKKTFKIK